MKITYLSHSCVHIETGAHKLLFDPFLTGNPLAPVAAGDVACDFILLTHGHDDHVGDAGDIARRTGAKIISNYEIATWFGGQGLATHGMYHGGKWDFPFGRAKYVLAHHGSGYPGPDGTMLYMGNPGGFVLTLEGKNVYHAGDTCVFSDMQLIGRMHPLDLAFLPIGDNFTMGIDEAVEALRFLRPKKVVPVHYNTFGLIEVDPQEFKARAGVAGFEVEVLAPGASMTL
jgi:L-ascorbate metabolism protein UlaG (beta-lactamase superfamily)